jgi:hypothetical protein
MRIDIVYLDDVDEFEVTFEELGRKPTTFQVQNGETLTALISALQMCTQNYACPKWEMHIKMDEFSSAERNDYKFNDR